MTITVAATFTHSTGVPATGLTLSEIDLYLTQQDKDTGADTVIWDGTQNPTEEIDNIGTYIRLLSGEDLARYNYFGRATYTGAVSLDTKHVTGEISLRRIADGPIDFTYTVTQPPEGVGPPIPGVVVRISTDNAKQHIVWQGVTDSFGVARFEGELPSLDPGVYYFWRNKAGVTFINPDVENVS